MSGKPQKQHTEFARRVAEKFDRLAFDLLASLNDRFDEPTAQLILSRTRFGLMDAVTHAETNTTVSVVLDLFGPTTRRSRKGGDRA